MAIHQQEKGNIAVISVKGILDLPNIEKLRDSLANVLIKAETILIDVSEVTFIDLSGIQLIHGITVKSAVMGKRFALKGRPSVEFIHTIERSGFSEPMARFLKS